MLGSAARVYSEEVEGLRRDVGVLYRAFTNLEHLLREHKHDEATKIAIIPAKTLGQEMGYEV